jgi:glycosyltransferase involved in cell wall biosynthesis
MKKVLKKHKVIFVMHDLQIGGAERVVLNLINNIDLTRFEVAICLFSNNGELVSQIRDGVRVLNLNSTRVLLGVHKLAVLLFKERPQIVFSSITHVNAIIGMIALIYKIFNKQTFFINREVNMPSIRAKQLKKSKKLDFLYKYAIHNFDLTIAQSNSMKKQLNSYYKLPKHKIKVFYNPVNHSYIESQLNGFSKEQVFNNELLNIVAVGNLRKQKGFDRLIEIFSDLELDYHLHIIGEGPERAKLESLIHKYNLEDKVSLLGTQLNPYKYLKHASILVSSSRYEGFPNVIIEANACGTYVVAFKCPGIDDELIINNLNGILINENNIDEYQHELKNIMYEEIKPNEIIETSMRFNVLKVVSEYENCFTTLIMNK